jgi:phenylalanyl-tRNA synthetase beta chain
VKIPYRWILEFVDLGLTPEEAAERLVNAGIEVASVTRLGPDVRGVVVGRIDAIERELGESHGHRLRLCRVSTGDREFSVVCGAPNAAVGVRAAFAPPGAVLPAATPGDGPRTIVAARLRNAESQGMLCSERELGLGDEHEAGILRVDDDAPLGVDLIAHLGLDDSVLEIEITPNRPDCLSVVGVARELSALTGATFRYPALHLKESDEPIDRLARLRVEAPDLCARYTLRVIDGVRVAPSPAWMAARLRAVGLRPISNVVDVTNYVLWELGHPLHAFDGDAVGEATIVVRRARSGEHLTTLDGQPRELTETMLVIADPGRAIGLAGVMGGANTEVRATTTRVLLESAYFDPGSIRRTSRALGLRTDAAYRFERGADVEALVDASARTAQLIAELAGGTIARGMIDAYPVARPRPRVRLRMARVARVIGVAPPAAAALGILRGLGFPAREREDAIDVEVPSFRRDVTMEDDLVEEIIRVWGYDKIPSTLPGGAISLVRLPDSLRQEQAVRQALVSAGLTEVVTYSFSNPTRDQLLGDAWPGLGAPDETAPARPLALLNPMSQDGSLMRRHLLEGILGVLATNVRRQQPDVRVFEIGRAYGQGERAIIEARWLAIALTGARRPTAWYAGGEAADVYDAKGFAEHVLATLGIRGSAVTVGGPSGVFEPDCHGTLTTLDGRAVAEFGEVRQPICQAFDIGAPVFAAVLPLDALGAHIEPAAGEPERRPPTADRAPLLVRPRAYRMAPAPAPRHEPLPRFPSVQRDMAFVVGAEQSPTAAEIEAAIADEGGPLLRRVTLFDVFRFPDGRRSLAWHLVFQAADRTLTDDEVNAIHARVARRVSDQFQISLRGV